MTSASRQLVTRSGIIRLPTYVPVTTFGGKYPLDDLVRPYLPRLASAAMVSWHFAKQMDRKLPMPLFVDSGGFAALFETSRLSIRKGLGILETQTDNGETEVIEPLAVLDLQEKIADVAFTLDFPIPPGLAQQEANRRKKLTIANALWALENRRRKDLLLFGCIQCWDAKSAREVARSYKDAGFDGVAIGGLVPRARDTELVRQIVGAVREDIPDLPLHCFGLGKPEIVQMLFEIGVDSVDSSSYLKLAASGKLWTDPDCEIRDASISERMHLALCNLAAAAQTTLPLSANRISFSTAALNADRKQNPLQQTSQPS